MWYAKKAAEQTRAVRTLQRNIDSQYYYRLLSSQNAEPVEQKMKHLTAGYHWRAKKRLNIADSTDYLSLLKYLIVLLASIDLQ